MIASSSTFSLYPGRFFSLLHATEALVCSNHPREAVATTCLFHSQKPTVPYHPTLTPPSVSHMTSLFLAYYNVT